MQERTQTEDSTYFKFRSSLAERSFGVGDLDHFSLFVGIHNFARKKYLVDQLEETLDVAGDIYEFGTWRGATTVLLAEWLRLRRPQTHKVVYGFDGFSGLPPGTAEDGDGKDKFTGRYCTEEEELRAILEGRGLTPWSRLVVGDVTQTAGEHFAKVPYSKVSFALMDVDLFEPTKAAIEEVLPNLSPGGKIVFDEGTVPAWEGEQRALVALTRMAEERGIRYRLEENGLTRQPTTVFTRLA